MYLRGFRGMKAAGGSSEVRRGARPGLLPSSGRDWPPPSPGPPGARASGNSAAARQVRHSHAGQARITGGTWMGACVLQKYPWPEPAGPQAGDVSQARSGWPS